MPTGRPATTAGRSGRRTVCNRKREAHATISKGREKQKRALRWSLLTMGLGMNPTGPPSIGRPKIECSTASTYVGRVHVRSEQTHRLRTMRTYQGSHGLHHMLGFRGFLLRWATT